MERAPHVLYVAWGFPPSRGGGVYRAVATANALLKAGFRVSVLTTDERAIEVYTGSDPSMLSLVDERITVHRATFRWPAQEADVRQWSALQALAPPVWRRIRRRLDEQVFPEVGYGPWRTELRKAADRIHRADPVDLVVATANPNVDLTVADHLWQTAQVPYVIDYRDAWLLDVFSGAQAHPDTSSAARWEARLFEHASEIWFVNGPIRQWHAERYPQWADRMHVVANGYDEGLAPQPRLSPPPVDRPLTFGYIGTVSKKVPMEAFLAGWCQAREQALQLATAQAQIWGYLGFYATADPRLQALLAAHADAGVDYCGPVPKRSVAATYDGFDVLLLILGAGRYVTSGKIFEYLASGLPIVSIHDPQNAASDVLRGYPLWFPAASLAAPDIAAALAAAADAARDADEAVRQACADFAERFRRDRQLDPRVTALAEAVRAR